MERYQPVRDIEEDRYLKVAVRGGAFYLYLPRDLVRVHGLMAGDRIEVRLKKMHRPKRTSTTGFSSENGRLKG